MFQFFKMIHCMGHNSGTLNPVKQLHTQMEGLVAGGLEMHCGDAVFMSLEMRITNRENTRETAESQGPWEPQPRQVKGHQDRPLGGAPKSRGPELAQLVPRTHPKRQLRATTEGKAQNDVVLVIS